MKFVKYFFDPCSLLHSAGSRLDLWPIPLHRATTAGCGDIKDVRLQIPMQIYSADGELIAQYGEKRRIPVTLDQIPPEMVKAFIATEDSRFYEHHGVDPVGSSVRQVWRCSPATRHKGRVPLPSSWREISSSVQNAR
ncbi:Penicillin-binding protein 1A [Escherichia coli]|uniref:Penicillin-binding protein 1A n=1 Tax=Escherichia coli TaxID=562 RepID=A0A377D9B7_ECOLX|nr:Penicillin-binding protein 1A [Escherichia coli]